MIWKIYGSKVVKFALYRDAIVQIINLAPPYLCNHQEYWIDYGDLNFRYEIRFWNIFCILWKSIHWNGEWADLCRECGFEESPFWFQGWRQNFKKYLQCFWTRDVNVKFFGSLIIWNHRIFCLILRNPNTKNIPTEKWPACIAWG